MTELVDSDTGARAETGEIDGAPFRIFIPESWNGGLVVWAHGVHPRTAARVWALGGDDADGRGEGRVDALASLGYAFAESLFRRDGFCISEGVADSEALRQRFALRHGRPYPTILAGTHMGGIITYASMERFPESYDAGLAIGGTAEPMSRFVAERAFRLRLLFDHFLPGLPGSVVAPPDGGGDPLRVYREAAALLRESPEHAEAFRSMVGIPTDALVARAVNTYSLVLADLVDTLGGNAVDNRNTVYTGSADDVALNRALPRYAADGPAVAALARLPKPTGALAKPLLAINPLRDPVLPVDATEWYRRLVGSTEASELFVQQFTDRVAYDLSPAELAASVAAVARWVTDGHRPPPGECPWADPRSDPS